MDSPWIKSRSERLCVNGDLSSGDEFTLRLPGGVFIGERYPSSGRRLVGFPELRAAIFKLMRGQKSRRISQGNPGLNKQRYFSLVLIMRNALVRHVVVRIMDLPLLVS